MEFGKDEFVIALQIGMFLTTSGAAWYAWYVSRNNASEERLDQMRESLENKITNVEKTVVQLEGQVRASPTHADLAKVYESINRVGSSVDTLIGENRSSNRVIDLIHRHILEREIK